MVLGISCCFYRVLGLSVVIVFNPNRKLLSILINILESMAPDLDSICDPWICSQTRICRQTRYRLRYATPDGLIRLWYKKVDNTF